jgi:pyruvate dehydrogenase E1 component beta subunit
VDLKLTYAQTINHTLDQLLASDEVILIGQGVTSPWYVGTTTTGLLDKYGPDKVIDTPVSENAVTGTAIGAAISGLRPIVMHPRMDFMWLAMDSIANQCANWFYMFGGRVNVPITIWAIINRRGEQAAQHSQNLTAVLAHIPGIKVVAPSNPRNLKGLLTAGVRDPNPVFFVDDRALYEMEGEVPEGVYESRIGEAQVVREGDDVSLVASSWLTNQALIAAEELEGRLSVEVVDLQTIKPVDVETVAKSTEKTGRALVVDAGWRTCGVGAEVLATLCEECPGAKLKRLTLPDTPAPANRFLEDLYYVDHNKIVSALAEVGGL